jgi:transcriptional regulator with XRE-family HTH domain
VPTPSELAALQKEFGANVRRQRNSKGMTQQRLSELADLSLRNIARIEAGEINILMTTVVRLCKALGCSAEKLMPRR